MNLLKTTCRYAPAAALMLGSMFFNPSHASASILYGATGAGGASGELVILNPLTGAVTTDVGPLVDSLGHHYSVTGISFQPGTGVLFGSTGNLSTTAPRHLITIDFLTALVTDIGAFGIGVGSTMNDLSFNSTGLLYGQGGTNPPTLSTINLATGAGTAVGPSGLQQSGGNGLEFGVGGTLFTIPFEFGAGSGEKLFSENTSTGAATFIALASGSVSPNQSINAMAFHAGVMYVSATQSEGGRSDLGTIDTTTGATTEIGITINNLDALAWQETTDTPEPGLLALGCLGLVGTLLAQRRKRKA